MRILLKTHWRDGLGQVHGPGDVVSTKHTTNATLRRLVDAHQADALEPEPVAVQAEAAPPAEPEKPKASESGRKRRKRGK